MPETGETVIDIPAQPVGSLRFTCGMGMYGGVIEFLDAGVGVAGAAQSQTQSQTRTGDAPPSQPAPNQGDPNFIGPVLRPQTAPAPAAIQPDADAQVVTINVSDYGYEPPAARAKANAPVKLVLQTQGAYG